MVTVYPKLKKLLKSKSRIQRRLSITGLGGNMQRKERIHYHTPGKHQVEKKIKYKKSFGCPLPTIRRQRYIYTATIAPKDMRQTNCVGHVGPARPLAASKSLTLIKCACGFQKNSIAAPIEGGIMDVTVVVNIKATIEAVIHAAIANRCF